MSRNARLAVGLALCASILPAAACGGGGHGGGGGPAPGVWAPTGDMAVARSGHTCTPLTGSAVLVLGGTSPGTAELYIPASGTFTLTNPPVHPRGRKHTATVLADSRVLVVGGEAVPFTAEVFDPFSQSFSLVAPPNVPRYGHVAVRLLDGRVLVAGGWDVPNGSPVSSAEIYDPIADAWQVTAPMPQGHAFAVAGVLPSNEVVIAGGLGAGTTAVLYSPMLNAWASLGDLVHDYAFPTGASPSDGRIALVAVGYGSDARGKVFDPATFGWNDAPSPVPHNNGAAVALEDGRVLVAGGSVANGPVLTNACEILDLLHASWAPISPLSAARMEHAAVRLYDGRVLVCGGNDGATDMPSAEVVTPP